MVMGEMKIHKANDITSLNKGGYVNSKDFWPVFDGGKQIFHLRTMVE